jgi:hypothetical protein
MKHHVFMVRNAKKIDYSFLGILLAIIIGCGLLFGVNHTYHRNVPMVAEGTPDDYTYENFWHKFNTYSVVMVNIHDSNHLVSQLEVTNFQKRFFDYFDLKGDSTIVLDSNGDKIKPDTLFCYMKRYDPNQNNKLDIIKTCNN